MSQRHCLLAALVASSCSSRTWLPFCYAGVSYWCLRTSARSPVVPPAPAMLFVSSTASATTGAAHIPTPQFCLATLFDWAGAAFLSVVQLGPAGLSVKAWLRRQLPLEGGDGLTKHRPEGWSSRWRHRARSRSRCLGAWWWLACPVTRLACASGGNDALAVRALCSAAFGTLGGASGGLPATPLSRRASWTALAWHACSLAQL